MTEPADSSRRDFLTGEAARRELLRSSAQLGDALLAEVQPETLPAPPVAGDTVRLETRAMACPWCVILNPGSPQFVMSASDALQEAHRIESLLTIYREDSETARLNGRASQSPMQVDQELFLFLKHCQELTRDTEGAFDAASGNLINLWRTCRIAGRIPEQTEIDETLRTCGMQQIRLDETGCTVTFARPVRLDFAAIGKGYAVDRVAEQLLSTGVSEFLVHGGHSSVRAVGGHAGQQGWPVALKNPLFTDRPYATLLLQNESLSSSGSNIQYFRYQGVRYGHILDPRSGWPANGLLSVTVVTSSAAAADALSTALYVMGLDKAQDYCHHHPEVGAILIPVPDRTRQLQPVVINIPPQRLFIHSSSDTD